MRLLLAVQLLVPLLLTIWPAVAPPRHWPTWSLHALALFAVTAALSLSGLWSIFPRWLPWSIAGAGLAILLLRRPRGGRRQAFRCFLLASVAVGASWQAMRAWEGRQLPGPPTRLGFPLPRGDYTILNGGANLAVSSHTETLDPKTVRRRLFQGQSYGVDIIALNGAGRSTTGFWPSDPRRYEIYGAPVTSPCAGRVVWAADGVPDQLVPDAGDDARTGNGVMLRCGDVDVLLAHFRPGSLAVRRGQRVRTGDRLGEVGNSGASNEPHLHIHAQRPGTERHPLSGEPVPMLLDGRWLVRGDRVTSSS